MTKESERKKIVEAIASADTKEEIAKNLKKSGFEFKIEKDDTYEFQMNGEKVVEMADEAVDEVKSKKKANI